eukprot:1845594-Rhodomonas_salina.1
MYHFFKFKQVQIHSVASESVRSRVLHVLGCRVYIHVRPDGYTFICAQARGARASPLKLEAQSRTRSPRAAPRLPPSPSRPEA